MEADEKKLASLLIDKIEADRKKTKRWALISAIIPLALSFGLLYFSYKKKKEADQSAYLAEVQIAEANELVSSKEKEYNELVYEFDSLRLDMEVELKALATLASDWEDLQWRPQELSGMNSLDIEEARKANVKIKEIILIDKEENNYKHYRSFAIKYYDKKVDSFRVKKAVFRTPFKDFQIVRDNKTEWFDETPSNRIAAHKSVDVKYIRYLALVLLQQGVKLKKIHYYKVNNPGRKNFIEISSDSTLIGPGYLSYKDIMALTADDLAR